MRTRKCAACGHHYESKARTTRKLLRTLQECGTSAQRIVAQLQNVAPLTDIAAQSYFAEQLREQVAAVHKQLVDRLFSICGTCCDAGAYYRRSPGKSASSERARQVLAHLQDIKPSLGMLIHFAGADHTSTQLSLAHIGGIQCSTPEPQSAGKPPVAGPVYAVASSPTSSPARRPRKSRPSSPA